MQRGLRAGARVMRHLCPTNHSNVRHISAGIRHTGPDPANQGRPGPGAGWVINYDRTQIPDLETSGTAGLTCHTLRLMVTRVQCLHCGGVYCTVLHCTVSLYCTVRGLDVTLAMICDWRERLVMAPGITHQPSTSQHPAH